MMMTILTKTAADGRVIEIIEIDTAYGPSCRARLDGEILAGHGSPQALKTIKGNVVAFLDTKPAVGLTKVEADLILAHLDATRLAARIAFDVTPEGQVAALRRERERLVDAIANAIEHSDRTFERMHAVQDALAWNRKTLNDQAVDVARAAVAAFDAAHPEAIAAIEAERAAEKARRMASPNWMWN